MRKILRTCHRVAVLWLTFWQASIEGVIGPDSLCSIYVVSDFSNNGTSARGIVIQHDAAVNPGFSHMAAGLIAIEHFNTRNASVIPELESITSGCSIQFDTNSSLVFDSGTVSHMSTGAILRQDQVPCAIAGPFSDIPAMELSIVAQALEFPMAVPKGYNVRLNVDLYSDFTNMVFPGMISSAIAYASFLKYKGRTNYIEILYTLSGVGLQRRDVIGLIFEQSGFEWDAQGYVYEEKAANSADLKIRGVVAAMKRVRAQGYRTILVAMEFPLIEMPEIANAAEELHMNDGDYFWVFVGDFEPEHVFTEDINITKLISGAAWLTPTEGHFLNEEDVFTQAWNAQTSEMVDRINSANPIREGEPGYYFAEEDFFQLHTPEYGGAYMYDAVMSIGIGACLAQKNEDGTIEGKAHLAGIHSVDFEGSTGNILFQRNVNRPGSRVGSTVQWAAFNFRPPQPQRSEIVYYTLTDESIPGTTGWTEITPFVYRDGRTVPPDLLRDTPDQNYLSPGLRALGLALMTTVLLLAVVTAVWVFMKRNHRVLRAAQPIFLYLLALGSAMVASTIVTISFDESYGWSVDQLNTACMTAPWLLSVGHMINYGALFSKLWRVNRVLQFARRKIEIRHVAWPSGILFFLALVVLIVWTAVDPLYWDRTEIDSLTGESIGRCDSDNMLAFVVPLGVILFIPTVMTGVMAWKTKDVEDVYAESTWIFMLIVVHLEVIVLAAPIVIILRDVNTDGRYIGFVLLLWIFPMSTLGLIMLPKVLAYYRAIRGDNKKTTRRGGGSGGVRVSGLSSDISPSQSYAANPSSEIQFELSGNTVASPNNEHIAADNNRHGNADQKAPVENSDPDAADNNRHGNADQKAPVENSDPDQISGNTQ